MTTIENYDWSSLAWLVVTVEFGVCCKKQKNSQWLYYVWPPTRFYLFVTYIAQDEKKLAHLAVSQPRASNPRSPAVWRLPLLPTLSQWPGASLPHQKSYKGPLSHNENPFLRSFLLSRRAKLLIPRACGIFFPLPASSGEICVRNFDICIFRIYRLFFRFRIRPTSFFLPPFPTILARYPPLCVWIF